MYMAMQWCDLRWSGVRRLLRLSMPLPSFVNCNWSDGRSLSFIVDWNFFASPVLFNSTQQIKITIEHIKFHWHACRVWRRPSLPRDKPICGGWFGLGRTVRMLSSNVKLKSCQYSIYWFLYDFRLIIEWCSNDLCVVSSQHKSNTSTPFNIRIVIAHVRIYIFAIYSCTMTE